MTIRYKKKKKAEISSKSEIENVKRLENDNTSNEELKVSEQSNNNDDKKIVTENTSEDNDTNEPIKTDDVEKDELMKKSDNNQ